MISETPMMAQFRKIKEQYPDAMLLFRCGDFYETYGEDAVKAAKILNITLTHRNNGGTKMPSIEMAGFPYHALETYLPKLVRCGLRVAICDQLEDPKKTKTLVKRGVTELVTPGVSYSDTTLQTKENTFVCCIHEGSSKVSKYQSSNSSGEVGIALLDISTGEFLVAQGNQEYITKLLTQLQPKEILIERGNRSRVETDYKQKCYVFELEDWMLTPQAAKDRLQKQFSTTSLKGYGVDKQPLGVIAAGGILHYLDQTQHLETSHIRTLSRLEEDTFVWIDNFTMRNLEILNPNSPEACSLLQVIDKTVSPMGGRLLRRWITMPLKDVKLIQQRQNGVDYFFRYPDSREALHTALSNMGDLERLTTKVATHRIQPRELLSLAGALQGIETCQKHCLQSEELQYLGKRITLCTEAKNLIINTIAPDASGLISKGGYIRYGVNEQLDQYRKLGTDSKSFMEDLCRREAQNTGIPSLKIGFTPAFGYYLEVRNMHKHLVPNNWIRKQTLVQAERYVTEELKTFEQQILHAEENIEVLERQEYEKLLTQLAPSVAAMLENARVAAEIDCLLSFATAAEQYHYHRPEVNDTLIIDIQAGRHPVIERLLPHGEKYIANDIYLDNNSQQIIILTGPNMAGKSALLRQTALIVLLAQIGSFVPADAAKIGIVDKIFTRVGASDNLSLGESTFMVEMQEAAAILNNLSSRSLVLFDELGRGTSTYDGISLAWAIVEYIHDNQGHAKTLFATHYHELNDMETSFERIKNFNVSVKEVDGQVIFLRKLKMGGSEHSFGINVARLAGMPPAIVKRAKVILKQLEQSQGGAVSNSTLSNDTNQGGGIQLKMFQLDDPTLEAIRDEIYGLDINSLTPLEALNKLSEIQKILKGR